MTALTFKSNRGVLIVRVFQAESGLWKAVISDKTGGLLNGDREITTNLQTEAIDRAAAMARGILAHRT